MMRYPKRFTAEVFSQDLLPRDLTQPPASVEELAPLEHAAEPDAGSFLARFGIEPAP